MVSGGVASQSDPVERLQFRADEIEAAVEQACFGTYVMAHAYSAEDQGARIAGIMKAGRWFKNALC